MDPKLKALLDQRKALTAEQKALLAKPKADRTAEDQARLDAILGTPNAETGAYEGGKLSGVNAEIAEYDRAVALETEQAHRNAVAASDNPTNQPRQPAQVHDKPGFRNLGEQLRAIATSTVTREVDPRLEQIRLQVQAASGASEAIPQDGGFIVQRDFTVALLEGAMGASQIMPRCRHIPVMGTGLDAPVFDETSRVTGSRFGGLQVYRNHEADAVTASKPKFGKMKMDLEDLSGLAYASDNLLADAAALGGIFQLAFQEEFGWVLDNEALNGTGAGQMLGILQSPALVSVAKEAGQAAATITYKNALSMWARLWARSYMSAALAWFYNQDAFPQIAQMHQVVGTGGVPVFLPAGGASGSPYASLFGKPLIPLEQCATLGTVGDLVLADFGQYVVIEKEGLSADSSIHVRFIQHETTFRWKMRNNGQPIWRTVLTPASGSANTLSPFVALGTRA